MPKTRSTTKKKKQNEAKEVTDVESTTKKKKQNEAKEVTDVEDLEEMRKLLQDIKAKQQNFEALRNSDLDKNEQNIREFKSNYEKRSQGLETMVLQLKSQIENLEHEREAILNQSQDSMEVVATSSNSLSSNAEVAKLKELVKKLECDFQKETEKNKRSESEIKHLREQVKRLELELKQECENSKKLTAKLPKTSVSRKLTPAELDQKSREMQEQISLYAEMSNLLIQNVKVISHDEKNFKCLHSGRNGTLEFKLSFKGETAHYEPSLQPDRDADLMAILPDYLKEPIDFQKESLDLFFWRILDFLQKK
ncbi:10270_t:CDS:2 [Dentiscutata erythropus]|uniref:10270_t:CDS:1 n=1 Tax=Dentiscutata erythropus TaxID=1348616 RepID=A0A9N9NPV3_9GLOM|nr:10270_t:CDS:2 [Dentiscutata erythropus]